MTEREREKRDEKMTTKGAKCYSSKYNDKLCASKEMWKSIGGSDSGMFWWSRTQNFCGGSGLLEKGC